MTPAPAPQPAPQASALRKALLACVGPVCAGILLSTVPTMEGTVLHTYRDPVGIVTACMGHTGPDVHMGETFRPDECANLLAGDLVSKAQAVKACVHVPLSDGELAAYTDFAFNEGQGTFCRSSIVTKLNAGDHAGACAVLPQYVYGGGNVLPGLVHRRAVELRLCLQHG